LNEYFVSSFQKVGTFVLAGNTKQGGNVASYFMTPNGHVLHVIPGPVDAATFLREARWVEESWKLAQLEARGNFRRAQAVMRQAHANRLQSEYGVNVAPLMRFGHYSNPTTAQIDFFYRWSRRYIPGGLNNLAQADLLLMAFPMPRIDQIYPVVFEKILNEKLSTAPVVKVG
jgi:hypothetical protein